MAMTLKERAECLVADFDAAVDVCGDCMGSVKKVECILELVKQAVAEEREANCKAMCPYCYESENFTPAEQDKHGWFHRVKAVHGSFIVCKAAAIRRGAKEER